MMKMMMGNSLLGLIHFYDCFSSRMSLRDERMSTSIDWYLWFCVRKKERNNLGKNDFSSHQWFYRQATFHFDQKNVKYKKSEEFNVDNETNQQHNWKKNFKM